ncbi:hypothetical protein DER45DRAFT_544869 [Fusarium avenaceum]|nr:hypothetical protein DER45DRAFT_544869 [Fusarium avenaceum]
MACNLGVLLYGVTKRVTTEAEMLCNKDNALAQPDDMPYINRPPPFHVPGDPLSPPILNISSRLRYISSTPQQHVLLSTVTLNPKLFEGLRNEVTQERESRIKGKISRLTSAANVHGADAYDLPKTTPRENTALVAERDLHTQKTANWRPISDTAAPSQTYHGEPPRPVLASDRVFSPSAFTIQFPPPCRPSRFNRVYKQRWKYYSQRGISSSRLYSRSRWWGGLPKLVVVGWNASQWRDMRRL